MFLGSIKRGGCVRPTTLPQSVSRLSRQCGIVNISQPYGPPRPLIIETYLAPIHFLYDLYLSTTICGMNCCRAQFPITRACNSMACDNSRFILLCAGQWILSSVYLMRMPFPEQTSLISCSDLWPVNSQLLALIFSINRGDLCPTVQHWNTNIYYND
jgi:hypothetical protein